MCRVHSPLHFHLGPEGRLCMSCCKRWYVDKSAKNQSRGTVGHSVGKQVLAWFPQPVAGRVALPRKNTLDFCF